VNSSSWFQPAFSLTYHTVSLHRQIQKGWLGQMMAAVGKGFRGRDAEGIEGVRNREWV